MTTIVISDGTITALAGGPLSLAGMGERTTKRVSHIEFCGDRDAWTVTDAETHEELASFPTYDEALAWEIQHYNERLRHENRNPHS